MLPPIINPGLRGDTLEHASTLSPHLVQHSTNLPPISKVRGIDGLLSDSSQYPTAARPRTANVSPRIARNALRLAGVEASQHRYPPAHAGSAFEQLPYEADLNSRRFSFQAQGHSRNRLQESAERWKERYDPRHDGPSGSPSSPRHPDDVSGHHSSPRHYETMSAPNTAGRDHRPGSRPGQFPSESNHPDPSAIYRPPAPGKDRANSTYPSSYQVDMERHRPWSSYENALPRGRHGGTDVDTAGRSYSPRWQATSNHLPIAEALIEGPAIAMHPPAQHSPPYHTPRLAPFSFSGVAGIPTATRPLSDLEERSENVSFEYDLYVAEIPV